MLQDDLFSTAGEQLPTAPAAPKKSRSSSKFSAPKLSTVEKSPEIKAEPVVSAPEPVVAAAEIVEDISDEHEHLPADKAPGAFKTISEVADFLGLPQHVLRFWESRFSQIKPVKLRGGRRYYRPDDIEVLSTIKHLLYKQGYTINGAKKAFSQGKNALIDAMHAEETGIKTAPKPAPKISDKQKNQLSAIRQELFALRETLRPFTQIEA
ncbi:MAG: MerR family transcriptional regulator [Alphaproteobacteria bacterium]|nr:MerR family transcriptional regulator [Alphaproteobacteria bacterium]